MDKFDVFPDIRIDRFGVVSAEFLKMGVTGFHEACLYVHEMPYGYNSNRDDLMILFKEKMGSCATKHAVVATLSEELGLPIGKSIGIYAMTEEIVTGTQEILKDFNLPYVPMIHCFLVYDHYRVDLTEGNFNGKNRPLDDFLYTETVSPNISAKDEYLIYRNALKESVLHREELSGVDVKRILQAREKGLALLRSKILTNQD